MKPDESGNSAKSEHLATVNVKTAQSSGVSHESKALAPSGVTSNETETKRKKATVDSASSDSSSSSSSESEPEQNEPLPKSVKNDDEATVVILSEQEMNKLGAKIVRAEIMGDQALADKLKAQLESSRKAKQEAPSTVRDQANLVTGPTNREKEVILTRTDRKGMVRPIAGDDDDVSMKSSSGKRKRKMKKVARTLRGAFSMMYMCDRLVCETV